MRNNWNHPAIRTLQSTLDAIDGERRLDDVTRAARGAADAPTFTAAERAWFRRPLG